MKYVGQFKVKLDDKFRFSIPVDIREQVHPDDDLRMTLNEMGFVEVGALKDLPVLSETFAQVAAPFCCRLPKIDKTGRIVLPQQFREIFRDEQNLIVFGRSKSFGISGMSRWPSLEGQFKSKIKLLLDKTHPE